VHWCFPTIFRLRARLLLTMLLHQILPSLKLHTLFTSSVSASSSLVHWLLLVVLWLNYARLGFCIRSWICFFLFSFSFRGSSWCTHNSTCTFVAHHFRVSFDAIVSFSIPSFFVKCLQFASKIVFLFLLACSSYVFSSFCASAVVWYSLEIHMLFVGSVVVACSLVRWLLVVVVHLKFTNLGTCCCDRACSFLLLDFFLCFLRLCRVGVLH
jgi:hypothetical protein